MSSGGATAEIDVFLDAIVARFAPDPSRVDDDEPLHLELVLDSLDFLVLVAAVRDEFGIVIPELDYPEISTLRKLRVYLVDQIESARPRY